MINKAQTLEFLKKHKIKVYNEDCTKRSIIDVVQDMLNSETIKPEIECSNLSGCHPSDEFICSNCGLIARDNCRYEVDEFDDESYIEFSFDFCPRCGAKVID